ICVKESCVTRMPTVAMVSVFVTRVMKVMDTGGVVILATRVPKYNAIPMHAVKLASAAVFQAILGTDIESVDLLRG
ncbi:hypothetical protein X801_06593, partial [Opisthorchis viverrini]